MKKKINVVKKTVATLALAGVMCSSVDANAASQVTSRGTQMLSLCELGDLLLPSWSVVNVDTTAREYYKLDSQDRRKYYKRTVYATFDATTSLVSWKPMVVPIRHINRSLKTTKTFTDWKETNSISADVDAVYEKVSEGNITYGPDNYKSAIWNVGITSDLDQLSSLYTMSLNYSTGK